jgi:hypothetical protein
MRGLRWSALALVTAAGLAGCGTGPRGFYASDPPRIPLGGSFTIEPGQEVIVYGVRAQPCGMTPPTFETAAGEMFAGEGAQGPAVGQVYDAGTGQNVAVLCGGTVPVRAIGYRAPENFEGEVAMTFYGTDQATVTVALPPEPEPEPEEGAESETQPEAEPGVEPEAAPEAAPAAPAGEPASEGAPVVEPPPPAVPVPEVESAPLPGEEEALPEEEVLPPEEVEEIRREEGPASEEGPIREEEIGPPEDPFIRGRELF